MDEKNVKELLDKEIQIQIESLRGIDVGSEEYRVAVDGLTKLLDKANDMDKISNELCSYYERVENQRVELDYKKKQHKLERNDRIVKNLLTAISIIGGFGLTIWGTKTTLKFEETGTITTTAGRNFITRLFPKK